MSRKQDEIISINVGGKKYTVRRSVLCADPKSKLFDWFKSSATKQVAQDRAGNYFLNQDGKSFRYIVEYLRLKRDKFVPSMALPSKADELSKLVNEAEHLNLLDLRDACIGLLQAYQRYEEQSYMTVYVNTIMRDYEGIAFEREGQKDNKNDDEDEWD